MAGLDDSTMIEYKETGFKTEVSENLGETSKVPVAYNDNHITAIFPLLP